MNNLARYTPGALQNIKNIDQLPPHITFRDYKQLRQEIIEHWKEQYKKRDTRRGRDQVAFYQDRDLLFFDLMWESGGRVQDICLVPVECFDFKNKQLKLWTRKRKKFVTITLGDTILLDISEYIRKYRYRLKEKVIIDKRRRIGQTLLFGFSRQQAWNLLKKYGALLDREDLHPHMFRHGLAVHMMSSGIPIPVISARLGHANIMVTQQMYLKVTPEIQRQMMEGVEMR